MPGYSGTAIKSYIDLENAARDLVGTPLRNGAIVLDARVQRNYLIVLAIRTDEPLGDYFATWAVSPLDGEAFWGHYSETLVEALSDFEDRLS